MSIEPTYFRSNANGFVYPDDNRSAADTARTITPVVVIDPEDDERVKALFRAVGTTPPGAIERVRDLLRSWTKPVASPKPDEPKRFGAMVVDRKGVKWLRAQPHSPRPWCRRDGGWLNWAGLDIPEDGVEFEGVE